MYVLAGCRGGNPLPDMRERYLLDKRPFGTLAAYRVLENSFPQSSMQLSRESFVAESETAYDTSAWFCSISNRFQTNAEEVSTMLAFAYRGNNIFIAANEVDSLLLNTLGCSVTKNLWFDNFFSSFLKESRVEWLPDANEPKGVFSYFYKPFMHQFDAINTVQSRAIGFNENERANCIVYFWGEGRIFLHLEPRAFSNYFLLTRDNYLYFQQLLQLFGEAPDKIYWSEYYAKNNVGNNQGKRSGSSLREILKHPALAAAWWLALVLLLVYMLFNSKRKQRIIQPLSPNTNSSVAFTETVARLYLQNKDNKNIAEKMITYFYEHTRSQHFLTGTPGTPSYIESLSKKSGVPLDKTQSLFFAIEQANNATVIDDFQLLALNEHIQQFYKIRNDGRKPVPGTS